MTDERVKEERITTVRSQILTMGNGRSDSVLFPHHVPPLHRFTKPSPAERGASTPRATHGASGRPSPRRCHHRTRPCPAHPRKPPPHRTAHCAAASSPESASLSCASTHPLALVSLIFKHNFVPTMIMQVRNARLPLMNLLRMEGVPILNQLHLEEKLLRGSSDNWCIINDGTNEPTIVMGVSGKPAELVEVKSVLQNQIPVIRRFTGGGTVIVDHGTVFVTFICNKDAVPGVQPYPQPIMAWSETLYNEVFHGVGDFKLQENDYVFGNLKFGGNAQSITKNRWIHHTSFLWDFNVNNMVYLKVPARAPRYRMARNHLDFVCRMKDYLPRSAFIDRTINAIKSHFTLQSMSIEEIEYPADRIVSPSSTPLTKEDLESAILTYRPQALSSQSL